MIWLARLLHWLLRPCKACAARQQQTADPLALCDECAAMQAW